MKLIKRHNYTFFTLVLLFLLSFTNQSFAQFWTEDFVNTNTVSQGEANGYSGLNGTWTVTTLPGTTTPGQDENLFYISCDEASTVAGNCSSGCIGAPPPGSPYIGASLHISANWGGLFGALLGCDCGSIYNAGAGALGGFDCATELRAESPLISCTGQSGITLNFNYIEFGDGTTDNAEVWYSANGGTTWTLLADMPKTTCGNGTGGPCGVVPCDGNRQGIWTTFTIPLPATANNNANVKIGFRWVNDNDGIGTDPSFAVAHILLSTAAVNNTIVAGNLTGPFCPGDVLNLSFTSTGTFTAPNAYAVQMSDAAGVFPVLPAGVIGSLVSTANAGIISITIPTSTPAGAGYLMQIVANNPATTSATIGPFTVSPSLPLGCTVAVSPNDTICPGEVLTFTATTTNGGTSPTFEWFINNISQGAASANNTFSPLAAISNGAIVTVVVTAAGPCLTGSPFTSVDLPITIATGLPFSVSISTVPSPPSVCAGDSIQFTATTINGGPAPTYQWTVGGIAIPAATSSTFNSGPIVVAGTVSVIATSSLVGCTTGSPDTASVTVSLQAGIVPSVTIMADTNSVCPGVNIPFVATAINGGAAPTYQWIVDGVAVPGAIFSTFNSTTLDSGAVVCCQMTSSLTCTNNPLAGSNCITVIILPIGVPTIAVVPPLGVCTGQSATFTVITTLAGNLPTYKWFLNDTLLVGTSASITLFPVNLVTGYTIRCQLTSSYPCTNTNTAMSPPFGINVLPGATLDLGPDVSIFYGQVYNMNPIISPQTGPGSTVFIWSPDSALSCNFCLNPIARPLVTTDYVLYYANGYGCRVRDTINVEVKPNYEIFIPTGFSPNGDNVNDVFYVRGTYISGLNMRIWDRWGNQVFESNYLSYGWDGTKNYRDMNTAVYVYIITVRFLDGSTQDFKGNISLTR